MRRPRSAALLWVLLIAFPILVASPMASSQITLPDTSCASAVGVGPNDIPHAYVGIIGATFNPTYGCPTHYPGENGFGVNGALLFAREGPSVNGGDGVVACFGSTNPAAGPTTGHHGAHTTIRIRDDVFGGSVGFTVMRDYNRSADNPLLPAGNNNGEFDCGDNIVEPCDPADPSQYTTPPGCNPLDLASDGYPLEGICQGIGNCAPAPIANSWVADGTLADVAGADGSITVLVWTNLRADSNHAGAATTGAIWTD